MSTEAKTENWDNVSFVMSSEKRQYALIEVYHGPKTPTDVTDSSPFHMSAVSRAMTELRQRGLIELLVSEDTKKGRFYGVTDRGRTTIGIINDNVLADVPEWKRESSTARNST